MLCFLLINVEMPAELSMNCFITSGPDYCLYDVLSSCGQPSKLLIVFMCRGRKTTMQQQQQVFMCYK